MHSHLRDLLIAEAGDPPNRITVEAVRRRVARRRAREGIAAGTGVAAAVVVGVTVAFGVGGGRPGPIAPSSPAHPPRFYVQNEGSQCGRNPRCGKPLRLVVRATGTGRVTAVIPGLVKGAYCQPPIAPADNQAFFITCDLSRFTQGRIVFEQTRVYRFQLDRSGHVSGLTLVKGGTLSGVQAGNMAATLDGSEVAIEVTSAYSANMVPEGIVVINTSTGARALWRTGPSKPGTPQYAGADDMSFTRDGNELAVLEARCPVSRNQFNCNGNEEFQLRAYSPAARGGSLDAGRVLLQQHHLIYAYLNPDGSAATALRVICPRHGPCALSVAQIPIAPGQSTRVLYQTHSGSKFQGIFLRFFSPDPSDRYLILDAAKGNARVNGWIDNGRLIPLTPANGGLTGFETW